MDSARIEPIRTGRRKEPHGSKPEPCVWKLRVIFTTGDGIVAADSRSSAALVEDLGSKNGTDLNGRHLQAGERYTLVDGDVLRVGVSFVIFRHEPRYVADASIP